MDTVVGTRESVVEGIKKIFNRYPKTFKKRFLTITSENGAEFMNAEAIEELGVTYFYAHSYCSWERGSYVAPFFT